MARGKVIDCARLSAWKRSLRRAGAEPLHPLSFSGARAGRVSAIAPRLDKAMGAFAAPHLPSHTRTRLRMALEFSLHNSHKCGWKVFHGCTWSLSPKSASVTFSCRQGRLPDGHAVRFGTSCSPGDGRRRQPDNGPKPGIIWSRDRHGSKMGSTDPPTARLCLACDGDGAFVALAVRGTNGTHCTPKTSAFDHKGGNGGPIRGAT